MRWSAWIKKHFWHVVFESLAAVLLLSVIAIVPPPREVVLAGTAVCLVFFVFVGAFRIWR